MKPVALFKVVLIAGLVFQVISVAAGVALVETLPPLLQRYLAEVANAEISVGFAILLSFYFLAVLVLMPVNYYGLWKFRSWARVLYVVVSIVFTLLLAFTGPVVMSGLAYMFFSIALILEGALIAMMFIGEVGEKFSKAKS
ncbi:hypothetical protein [Pseudomonas flexibilis]|uniref:hypothetical protein n=1 Tax=Pseudomonas flexibilis TaxID=706570 RepID=UPI00057FFC4F|nr:hypothetical protein [Pseudomonas flexibilis]